MVVSKFSLLTINAISFVSPYFHTLDGKKFSLISVFVGLCVHFCFSFAIFMKNREKWRKQNYGSHHYPVLNVNFDFIFHIFNNNDCENKKKYWIIFLLVFFFSTFSTICKQTSFKSSGINMTIIFPELEDFSIILSSTNKRRIHSTSTSFSFASNY